MPLGSKSISQLSNTAKYGIEMVFNFSNEYISYYYLSIPNNVQCLTLIPE